jgi:hypothetical protein
MANKNPKPTDQRSNVKNPNNTGFKTNQDNKANQLNPNHQPTKTAAPPPAIKK